MKPVQVAQPNPIYLRRHATFRAIQYTGENLVEVTEFINGTRPDVEGDYAGEPWAEYAARINKGTFTVYRYGLKYMYSGAGSEILSLCRVGDYVAKDEEGWNIVIPKVTFEADYVPAEESLRRAMGTGKHDYVRRNPKVSAIQFTGENIREVQTFINGREPDTKSQYASEKWEEFCAKVKKDGFIEIPSSLGYDPVYSKCLPSDYVVSESPGVYSVMGKESFETQYWRVRANEIMDTSGLEELRTGHGPLQFTERKADDTRSRYEIVDRRDPSTIAELQAAYKTPSRSILDGGPEVKGFLTEVDLKSLSHDLVVETERAMEQRDRWKQTNVSTASHGGSHDTCFEVILRKYIETDIQTHYGIRLEEWLKVPKEIRASLLSMMGFAKQMAKIKSAAGPIRMKLEDPESIAKALEEVRNARMNFFPEGSNSPERVQYRGIVASDEIHALMNEKERFETTASLLKGRSVNWHTLVGSGNRVFGTTGVLVGLRRRTEDTTFMDVAFPQNNGESFMVINNLVSTFLEVDEADIHKADPDELLCCPPDEFDRIRELLNAAVNRNEGTRPKAVEPVREDQFVKWSTSKVGTAVSRLTNYLLNNLDGLEDGKQYWLSVALRPSAEQFGLDSFSIVEDTAVLAHSIDSLDDATALIHSFLNGDRGPLTKDEAEALATHRHYKGGLYYRLLEVTHTETQEALTVYLHLYPHEPSGHARPLVMFDGKNDAGEIRFVKIR
jgi:hypothetical protein